MRLIYPLTCLLALLLVSCSEQKKEQTVERIQINRPNVIFILADDLGAGDLHCTGHPYAQTPNLDALAERGIRYERAYMAAAWCAPSRYGLMTGIYPARLFDKTGQLEVGEQSITHALKGIGYETAHFGKWHMTNTRVDSIHVSDYGIDQHYVSIFKGKGNVWKRKQRLAKHWRAKSTDTYVDMTIQFLDSLTKNDPSKPFYVNLWVHPTHSYIDPTDEQLSVYEGLEVNMEDFSPYQQAFLETVAQHGDLNRAMQAYCADITAMDAAVGRLLNHLDQKGLSSNTLVVFSSDNGPAPSNLKMNSDRLGDLYERKPALLNNVGSSGEYRDRKAVLFEGGIRVPLIIHHPDMMNQGTINDSTVFHGTDWLPSIASICGASIETIELDGQDLSDALMGGKQYRNGEIYWRDGDQLAVLAEPWKAVTNQGRFYLFNILEDPNELNDLSRTEVERSEVFRKKLDEWEQITFPHAFNED